MSESPDPPRQGLSALKLGLAATLALLVLAWLCAQTYHDRRWAEARMATLGRMELAGEEIARLDEALTFSARLAVASGTVDPKAPSRQVDSRLDQHFKEALRLEPRTPEGVAAAMTASAALAAMEQNAFELLQQGEKAEAQRLLSSGEYAARKEMYAKGMAAFNRNLRQVRDVARVEVRTVMRRIAAQSILTSVLLLLGVWWALLVERRWHVAIEKRNRKLRQKSAELGELNNQLDRKVSERTKHVNESALASLNMMQDAVAARSDLEAANKRLQVANRSLRALSESSQAMGKAPNQQALLDRVCEILVTTGEYRLAWVGYAMDDEAHSVRPVARAGAGAVNLDYKGVYWADTEQGQGPTGSAIRSGRPSICRTMACDPQFAPWRDQASRHGYLSSMALPLRDGERVLGALNVYSAEPDAFEVDEQHLLEQLASDLAYGIVSWQTQGARREAEEALRLTESKYAGLFETTRDAIMTIDPPAWGFSAGNSAAVKLFGAASEKDFLALSPWDVSPEFQPDGRASAEKAKEAIECAMREGSHQFEWTHRRIDGTEFPADVLLTRMMLAGQSRLHATVRDITERKRADDALRESEERFAGAFEHAPIGMALVSPEGRWLKVNRRLCELLGYSAAELVARTFQDITHPDDLKSDLANVSRMISGEIQSYQMEKRYVHKRGHTVTVLLSVSLVRDAHGQPRYFVSQIQDITERRQAEARSLRQRDALIDLTTDAGASDAEDPAAALQRITEAVAATLGVARVSIWRYTDGRAAIRAVDLYEQASGRHSAGMELLATDYPAYFRALASVEVISADDACRDPRTREFASGYLQPLGISAMLDAPIQIGGVVDGILCHEHVGSTRVWTTDEKNFAVAMANRVSLSLEGVARKQAEQALQEANRGLESKVSERTAALKGALRAKDMFMANMSHELRTPLNAILGFTGTLLMKLPGAINAQQEEQLNIVKASARHLLSLINDLLDLSKIESGNMQMQAERVNCRKVLEDIAVSLRPHAETKGLSLALLAPDQEVHVSTDARALKQIVLNLCNNAIKFTDAGSVTLELKEPVGNQPVEIGVTDTGIGIRPEDQDKLFQVFSQMDSTRRDGAGLGLHLSQKLAHLIHGKVHFTSDYGHGSRFWLTLPRE